MARTPLAYTAQEYRVRGRSPSVSAAARIGRGEAALEKPVVDGETGCAVEPDHREVAPEAVALVAQGADRDLAVLDELGQRGRGDLAGRAALAAGLGRVDPGE